MLTDEQQFENKLKFIELLGKLNIDMTAFMQYLDGINYFDKPASTQYAGAYAGGLCEQALRLAHELGILCNAYLPGRYTEADVIRVALCKELYRAELYEYYQKNVKNDTTGQWETVGAYRNKEVRPVFGDINFSSYMIAKQFIDFTDEQIEAIIYASSEGGHSPDSREIMRKYPLVTLTKMAEMAAAYLGD